MRHKDYYLTTNERVGPVNDYHVYTLVELTYDNDNQPIRSKVIADFGHTENVENYCNATKIQNYLNSL